MKLCPPCSEEWVRWLNFRPPALVRIHTIGSDNHTTREGRRTIETVRAQQRLIKQNCERSHSA